MPTKNPFTVNQRFAITLTTLLIVVLILLCLLTGAGIRIVEEGLLTSVDLDVVCYPKDADVKFEIHFRGLREMPDMPCEW